MASKPFVLNPLLFGLALMDIDIYRMARLRRYYEKNYNQSIHNLCSEHLSSWQFNRANFVIQYACPLIAQEIVHFRKEIEGW